MAVDRGCRAPRGEGGQCQRHGLLRIVAPCAASRGQLAVPVVESAILSRNRSSTLIHALGSAERVLVVGIGGGGDVVGALAVAELARLLGTPAVVGGLTWERRPIDPGAGPRRIDELTAARPINSATALACADTTGPGGFHFAESHMARHLGEPVL